MQGCTLLIGPARQCQSLPYSRLLLPKFTRKQSQAQETSSDLSLILTKIPRARRGHNRRPIFVRVHLQTAKNVLITCWMHLQASKQVSRRSSEGSVRKACNVSAVENETSRLGGIRRSPAILEDQQSIIRLGLSGLNVLAAGGFYEA